MTLEELQEMTDHELDRLAAIKLLWSGIISVPSDDWKPTRDMNCAWRLVNILHDDCFGFALINVDEEWSAWFIEPDSTQPHKEEGRILCKEAARAITIAAIMAKG